LFDRHFNLPHGTKMRNQFTAILTVLLLAPLANVRAIDYPYRTAEPQKTGWPLTEVNYHACR
jgi:hypothetical protein